MSLSTNRQMARLFFILATLAAVVSALPNPFEPRRACGSPGFDHVHGPAIEAEISTFLESSAFTEGIATQNVRTINVYYHVISKADGTGSVSDDALYQQVDVLNNDYGSSFNFVVADIDRTTSDEWFDKASPSTTFQTSMKSSLRRGGAADLNVYTVGFTSSNLLGYATFPSSYPKNPTDDGIVLLYSSLPGGSTKNYNLGRNTYPRNGVAALEKETLLLIPLPSQSSSVGCPVGRDSCPDQEGLDPITNFMDYSYDSCLTGFTAGQFRRMFAQTSMHRNL
ncbi:hypothetical protein BC829DRAFT_433572 [Chytridium lagenaria]|nr:hypothetical protein BC829DRAFT_433572 [Chytridium lagenaria]